MESIIWKNENFHVQPFYRDQNYSNEKVLGNYLRNSLRAGWQIQQSFQISGSKKTNRSILDALANNCSSLLLEGKIQDLTVVLNEVLPELINIYVPSDSMGIFLDWIKDCGVSIEKINGGIMNSPLSTLITEGQIEEDWREKVLVDIEKIKSSSQFKIIKIDGGIFENAGASIVQQLAHAISMGHDYLESLKNDIGIDDLSARIYFEMNIGPSYFMEIAKLRALRILWAKLISAFGPKYHCSMHTYIISNTSRSMLGVTDFESNLIRNTTSALAAAIGGSNEIRISSHDGSASSNAQRLSRNIQNLLKEESHIDKVADHSGGSHYIEHLTHSLVEHAWEEFMRIEMNGGFLSNVWNGSIQSDIYRSAAKKIDELNNGTTARIGVNKYIGPTEKDQFSWSIERSKQEGIQLLPRIKCRAND